MRAIYVALTGIALTIVLILGQPSESASTKPETNNFPIDLTHPFNEETVYWPTAPKQFKLEPIFVGETQDNFYYSAYWFHSAEHGGTHMDAPKHMGKEDQTAIHEIPLAQLQGPAAVVDVTQQALSNHDYRVTTEDLQAWEAKHGTIPSGAVLILRTGYWRYYSEREPYMGTAELGEQALSDLHFPGLHPDAASWLVENRSISAVGIDTPSIDYGQSKVFMAHRKLFQDGIVAIENLANLEQLPATGFQILALPMKIESGSGAPVRVVALSSQQT